MTDDNIVVMLLILEGLIQQPIISSKFCILYRKGNYAEIHLTLTIYQCQLHKKKNKHNNYVINIKACQRGDRNPTNLIKNLGYIILYSH